MKVVDKNNEIIELFKKQSEVLENLNKEIHLSADKFNIDRYSRLIDEYDDISKKMAKAFSEKNVLIGKWNEDLKCQAKRILDERKKVL